ncbi:hypothetical protein M8J77_017089 [Diaphorina citri]|nr:hypothetical protein M8J77_017089 [Diaphorina citri]
MSDACARGVMLVPDVLIASILAAMHKEESVYRDIQQACESLGFLCQLATSLDQCVATSCSYLPHVILAAMHKEESVYRDIQQACESLGFLCQLATSPGPMCGDFLFVSTPCGRYRSSTLR